MTVYITADTPEGVSDISPVPLLPLSPVQAKVLPAISDTGVIVKVSPSQISPLSGVPCGSGFTVNTISKGSPGQEPGAGAVGVTV